MNQPEDDSTPAPRWRLVSKLLLPVIFTVLAGGIAYWLASTDNGTLRGQLIRWQFWALEVQFVLFVGLGWLVLPKFVQSLGLRRRALIATAAISLLALALAGAVAPQTNRIYYDEHIYQGVAQNIDWFRDC